MQEAYNPLQLKIWRQISSRAVRESRKNRKFKAVYVDGVRYRSFFEAGIDSGISYVSISTKMKKSGGAPVIVGYSVIVAEEWIFKHPEYLF